MKITIYELLGLIKDGKAPYKIKYQDYKWIWTSDDYKTIKGVKECFLITGQEYTWVTEFLNDEVEILDEEDEFIDIEEINNAYYHENQDRINQTFKNAINDLIKNQRLLINKINERNDKND